MKRVRIRNRRLGRHLQVLQKIKKIQAHPLLYHIHKKYGISKKTLFYTKEYGPRSNVPGTILKESLRMLLFASVLSSLGGLSLESIKPLLLSVMPLVILLPALSDMIGDYGIIFSSRFSTMLHEGKVRGTWWNNRELRKLLAQVMLIAMLTASASSLAAIAISWASGYGLTSSVALKIAAISLLDTVFLVSVLFLISVMAGIHYFKKGEDPNNFLIPITTSVADFGNMILLSVLVILFL